MSVRRVHIVDVTTFHDHDVTRALIGMSGRIASALGVQ